MTNAPPGWHPDPAQAGSWRWWDGSQWTHQTTQTPPDQQLQQYAPPTGQPSTGAPQQAEPQPQIQPEPAPQPEPQPQPPPQAQPVPPVGEPTGAQPPPPTGPSLGPPTGPGQSGVPGQPGLANRGSELNLDLEPITWAGLGAFAIAALGTLLPWVGASFFSLRGTSDWRGLLSFLCAVTGAGLLFFFTQQEQKQQVLAIGTVAAAGLIFLLTLAFAGDVSSTGSFVSVGLRAGWFLTFLGSIVAGGVSIMTLLRNRPPA